MQWLQNGLLPSLTQQGNIVKSFNKIIGGIKLEQTRSTFEQCTLPVGMMEFSDRASYLSKGTIQCIDQRSTAPPPEFWEYLIFCFQLFLLIWFWSYTNHSFCHKIFYFRYVASWMNISLPHDGTLDDSQHASNACSIFFNFLIISIDQNFKIQISRNKTFVIKIIFRSDVLLAARRVHGVVFVAEKTHRRHLIGICWGI